jgi:hypothetical protein
MSIISWLCCPKGLALVSLVSGGGLGVTMVCCCGSVVIPSGMKWRPQVRGVVVRLGRRGMQYIYLCEVFFSMVIMCVVLLNRIYVHLRSGLMQFVSDRKSLSQL